MWMSRLSVTILLRAATSVAAAGAISCAGLDGFDVSTVSEGLTCSGFGCNSNSPIIAGAPFYELHRAGQPNDQGLRITAFTSRSGQAFRLDVQQARLVGLDANGRIALDTSGITGAVIKVVDAMGLTWEITVLDTGAIGFWAPPAGTTTTYLLQVHPPGAGEKDYNLCTNPPAFGDWPGNVLHAILFEGDRYRPSDKTVLPPGPTIDGWFNIACAGTATAKMHLTRHTAVGASPTVTTTQPQRQAMLKAYTASVCPGSDSFTGMGEKLIIDDYQGLMSDPPNLANIEALWGPSGAICKGEWRLVHANSMPQSEADALLKELVQQCPNVPDCSTIAGFPGNWTQHGMVLTTNP
jgi:hypothetical protein